MKFAFAQVRASNGLSGEWSEPLFIPLFPELYPNCGKHGCLTLMTIQCESDAIAFTSFLPSFRPSSLSSCPVSVVVQGVEERKSEDGSFPVYAIAIIAAVGLIVLLLLVTVAVVVLFVNYRRRKLLLESFKVHFVEVNVASQYTSSNSPS